jgi:hypothetical protein
MDQKLFRELENLRGREKRSTFIEHLIVIGLKSYKIKREEFAANNRKLPVAFLSPVSLTETQH